MMRALLVPTILSSMNSSSNTLYTALALKIATFHADGFKTMGNVIVILFMVGMGGIEMQINK